MTGVGWSGGIHAALDGLLAADLHAVGSPRLLAELAALTSAANRVAAAQSAVLAEIESRRRDGDYGGTRTSAELLCAVAPMTARAASQRVEVAYALAPGRSLTGEPLPAMAAATAAAARAGTVSAEQAVVIVDAVRAARAKSDATTAEIVERALIEACQFEQAHRLRAMAAQLLAATDQDGDEPVEPGPDPRRGLTFRRRANGLWRGTVDLDGPDHAAVLAVLESLSAPKPAPQSPDDQAPGGDRDPRSAAQRRADALLEVFARVRRSGTLPAVGGAPVTVLVTTTLTDLLARRGVAATDHGEPWPVPDLLAAARGEWALLPVVTDERGAVLDLGREQRFASCAQRRALTARDGGCSFPGCDRPPSFTEAHHIVEWRRGGQTDLDNLCLLCAHHHRTFGAAGWSVHTGEDRLPYWLPPPWVDPQRRPRRNRSHRRPELAFAG